MQQNLFSSTKKASPTIAPDISEWGTFKDSLRAPVHSWFTYPAGFSYKAVQHSIHEESLKPGSTVYDPFMGSGTTNIVAKQLGINSIGIEAHPFVFPIAQTKMEWDVDIRAIDSFLVNIEKGVTRPTTSKQLKNLEKEFPELVRKCFLPESLLQLSRLKEAIRNSKMGENEQRFLITSLICTLRDVSIAATGWPYIAPKKIKITSMSKNAWGTFYKRTRKMLRDIEIIKIAAKPISSTHTLILGDSRKTNIKSSSVDLIFTSPPYLNNFDYADRTRLEMYFVGDAKDWKDISQKVRTKLMTSATTQISRNDPRYVLSKELQKTSPEVYDFLKLSSAKLSELRKVKGGKKSYDLLISGYFNDIYPIIRDNFRVLKKGSKAIYILGDSAPYGIHIPTDEIIGKLGIGLGFERCNIEVLRERGGKWKDNPQRHSVALRESVVTLIK